MGWPNYSGVSARLPLPALARELFFRHSKSCVFYQLGGGNGTFTN
nr:MAG TPA: hypothetical protein [Caudoviricetes sp.]